MKVGSPYDPGIWYDFVLASGSSWCAVPCTQTSVFFTVVTMLGHSVGSAAGVSGSPGGSVSRAACSAGDPGAVPGSGRPLRERK